MKASVVCATFNRAHLLRRALESYIHQDFPLEDFELVYVDDWSQDETDLLLREYSTKLNIVSIRPNHKPEGSWRSEASVINLGLRAAKGEIVIATHPEILVGRQSIGSIYESGHNDASAYHCCKVYFLSEKNTQQLDSVDWKSNRLVIRELPGFYTEFAQIAGATTQYNPQNIEATQVFDSWVFGGMHRTLWDYIGGFYESDIWGSIDIDFLHRRGVLQIQNITLQEPETICIHQNHDSADPSNPFFVPTVRDMDACLRNLRHYERIEDAILNNL